LPDTVIGEIIDGELVVSPRPASRHARIATQLTVGLGKPFDEDDGRGGPGGWWILFEPELKLGRHTLVPDIAGWRRERMPEFPDVPAFELAPDWVCEIISPQSARRDRIAKPRIYAKAGVEWLWLIDPAAKTLEVLRHKKKSERWEIAASFGEEPLVRAPPFDAVELELARWW